MIRVEKRSIKVNIFGSEYTIKAKSRSSYIRKLAKYVDDKMQEIAKHTSLVSSGKVATLAALNIADELHRIRLGKKVNVKDSKEVIDGKETIENIIKKIDKVLE